MNRWNATVYYRSNTGSVDVLHTMTELYELQTLIENGPHWDTIEKIEIVRACVYEENLTIEKAETL